MLESKIYKKEVVSMGMGEDEYELMPHKEIEELKKEIEILKANPLGEGEKAKSLMEAINVLTKAIHTLIYTFEHATEELKEEKEAQKEVIEEKKSDSTPLMEKMNELIEQNKEIAEGIISVAQIVKKEKRELDTFGTKLKPFRATPFSNPVRPPIPKPEPRPTIRPNPSPFVDENIHQMHQPMPSAPQPMKMPEPAPFEPKMTPPPGNPNPIPPSPSTPNSLPGGFDMPPPPFAEEKEEPQKKKGFLPF